MWKFLIFQLFLVSLFLEQGLCGRQQQIQEVRNVIATQSISLPCAVPGADKFLKWKFKANKTDSIEIDAAQVYPGSITSIFNQFNLPPGRSSLAGGSLVITEVGVRDEGLYWCEISGVGQPTVYSDKIPVHVWVTPQNPQIVGIGNGTVLEYTETAVARCSSKAGKPEASLVWMNGSVVIPNIAQPVVSKNAFTDDLFDISLDLILSYPTRFDHGRNFQCVIDHPAYSEPKSINHSVNVLYHPVNARIWANNTSKYVYCEADGYPTPTYSWVIPGNVDGIVGPELYMTDLFLLPGNEYFQCTADNGIPDPLVVRVTVDNLLYPYGKPVPQFLGLDWFYWLAIGGGILILIIVVIVIIVYCCKKKKAKKLGKGKPSSSAKYSKPSINPSNTRHSQPSLLEFDSMRTPDGRESSRAPSEVGTKKSMPRSYSLEHLVEEKYGEPRSSVQIVPNNRMSYGNHYDDTSLNRHASREEIDKVADHIEVLNKSWDHLARSKEHLDRSREELRVELPPRYQSHDDLHHPHHRSNERLADQDNYPYMDDTLDNRRYNPHSQPMYREEQTPRRQYYDTYNDENGYQGNSDNYNQRQNYDDQDGYQGNGYDDQTYNQQTDYRDNRNGGYRDSRDAGYDRNGGYRDDRDYNQQNDQSQYYDRNNSYDDNEFDDDQSYNYDRRGYQPSNLI
uniref:uncharacterized protein LOC100175475 isoform X1 n=1 Tax=Ciona intestinalis TaxID=7719 RepID=UPI00006A4FE9|nr:uncharacterized protein LOC100175475 isoform X1 [Ciona intestinalis]|eukprot:XP_002121697.1 uncharacterized protein LOC100175475 isoform X1 [Ciona intestinalis]